jgi:hypothetical protein
MVLTLGKIVQIIAALVGAIAFFVMVYRLPEKRVLALLIAIIPIQVIDSQFGTINTFLTYVVAFAFILQGRLKAAPLLWSVFGLMLAYAISFAFSHPDSRIWHILYMIGFVANFLLFYMVYNFVSRTSDWQPIVKGLLAANALVVVACVIEIVLSDRQVMLFGLKEWTLGSPRAHQDRIVGPFGSTHTTADYLVAQCMLIAYWLVHRFAVIDRRWLLLLLCLNIVCLIATGDRGGFIGFLIGGVTFVWLFRKEIGGFGIVKYSAAGAILFVLASFVVIEYTEFGRLYERLGETEISVEDHARASIFERGRSWFREKPIVGAGPRLNVSRRNVQIGDIEYRGALPHNLYLTILASTGIVGMIAWCLFFISAMFPLVQALRRRTSAELVLANLPKLGLLIVLLFLIGEIRIEFLRQDFFDYQNYIFVLLALFVACAHLVLQESNRAAAQIATPTPLGDPERATGGGRERMPHHAQGRKLIRTRN